MTPRSDHDTAAASTPGISRREALKKGAMVGGTVLWVAPLVQTVGVSQAFGQQPTPPPLCGRFTGGGRLFNTNGEPVYHGFQLRCGVTGDASPGNNMVVVGKTVDGERFIFKLDTLSVATCFNDQSIGAPNPPAAGFNTFVGVGTGQFRTPGNQSGPFTPGYRIEFTFTDQGEPGTSDTAKLQIFAPGGALVVDVSGDVGVPPGGTGTIIGNGNNQAHAPGGHRAELAPCD